MSANKKNLENWGNIISCLGGLLVILNFGTFKDSGWELEIAFLAVVLTLFGLYLLEKGKKAEG